MEMWWPDRDTSGFRSIYDLMAWTGGSWTPISAPFSWQSHALSLHYFILPSLCSLLQPGVLVHKLQNLWGVISKKLKDEVGSQFGNHLACLLKMASPPTLTTSNKQPAPRCFINATENRKIFSLESLINPNYYFWEGRLWQMLSSHF